MQIFRCDLCRNLVSGSQSTRIRIGDSTLHCDEWDICMRCANDLMDKLNDNSREQFKEINLDKEEEEGQDGPRKEM